jgi:hypothetical protein
MPKTTGARGARPNTCEQKLLARAKDAERKRRAYWADPDKSRAKGRAKRRRNIERCRAQSKARYWANSEKNRAQARERARSERGRESNRKAGARFGSGILLSPLPGPRRGRLFAKASSCRPRSARCGGGCQTKGLHTHHNNYEKPAKPTSISTLCRDHHYRCHREGKLKLKAGSARRWAALRSVSRRHERRRERLRQRTPMPKSDLKTAEIASVDLQAWQLAEVGAGAS